MHGKRAGQGEALLLPTGERGRRTGPERSEATGLERLSDTDTDLVLG